MQGTCRVTCAARTPILLVLRGLGTGSAKDVDSVQDEPVDNREFLLPTVVRDYYV